MKTLEVCFKSEKYPVYVGEGLLSSCGERIGPLGGRACLVVTDDHVSPLYGEAVKKSLADAGARVSTACIPAGEEQKSAARLGGLYDALLDAGVTRSGLVVALGGGVVGDLAGYAAATFLRGVPYVQMPTTLLAQVDSAVGGKVAVNHPRGKNLIGAFYSPACVLADTAALRTLSRRQLLCGMAEVLKYGAICDARLFEMLEKGIENALSDIDEIVYRCILHKEDYVRRDPLDMDVRMELNFGHTLGHALENAAGYGVYTHGEAISVGMAEAARWGEKLGVTEKGAYARMVMALDSLGLPSSAPRELIQKSLRAVVFDKKARGDIINVVLLSEIGRAEIVPLKLSDLAETAGGDPL